MISIFKNKAVAAAEFLHIRIFGERMGDGARKFFKYLSWSLLGGTVASIILFMVNILAGRWLGPVEYGKYGLVVSISSIFIIPMTLGVDTASVHYISKAGFIEEKRKYMESSIGITSVLILTITVLGLIFSNFLADLFSVQAMVIRYVFIFSLFLAAKNIFDSFVRGFHLFKFQSRIKILEACLVLSTFFLLVGVFDFFNFRSYVYAAILGYAFTNIVIIYRLKKWLNFSTRYAKKIISYGFYGVLGSLFGIMINSFDKIFINRYIGSEQLGVYIAYSTISVVFVNQLIAIFINVFFPYLSANQDQGAILHKINRLFKIFCIPFFLILCAIILLVITILGKAYPLDWLLVGEFSLLGVIFLYFNIIWWLIASKGRKGIRFTAFNGIGSGLSFIFLMMLFKENLTLHYVVLFLTCAILYNISIGNLFYARIKQLDAKKILE